MSNEVNKIPDVLVELEYKKLFKAIEGIFYTVIDDDYIHSLIKTDYVKLTLQLNSNLVDSVNDKIDKLNLLNKDGWQLSAVKFKHLYKNNI